MTSRMVRPALHACALSLGLVLLLVGCGPRATVPATEADKAAMETSATAGPGPFVMPAERLVVPETLVPITGKSKVEITDDVRRAFGPMLAEVSVVATSVDQDPMFAGMLFDFKVQYRLVDCPVPISSYLSMDGLTGSGLVPPLTQFQDTPPGRDWMSGERFRTLLRAWGEVSHKPFGGLESYSTARQRQLDDPVAVDETSATVGGKTRRISDLWVVTPGAETKAELVRLYRNGYTAGYVFSFPQGGAAEFLGSVRRLGEFTSVLE